MSMLRRFWFYFGNPAAMGGGVSPIPGDAYTTPNGLDYYKTPDGLDYYSTP